MATLKLMLTILVTVIGASFQFYSFAVLNTPQEIVESWINTTYLRRNGVGLTASSLTLLWSFTIGCISIGAFIGSILTRSVAEVCGRRNGLIANAVLNVVGGGVAGLAKSAGAPELLLLGRFILGVNMGLSSGLAPMYLTEIAPVHLRGAAGTAHMISVAFGDWFSLLLSLPALLGSAELWPLAVLFPALPALVLAICLPFCPQSPRYLLMSLGDRKAARKAVEFFSGEADAPSAFEELVKEAAIAPSTRPTIMSLFHKKELRTPLLISVLVMISQQFTGAAAIFAYSSSMFQNAGISVEVSRYCTLGIGIAYFVCTLPSPYLIERMGRRSLSLLQLSGCLVCLVLLTTFIGLQQTYGWEWTSFASIGALVAFMCVYGVGSPIPWMISSELFHQTYRSSAVAISTFVAWFFAFIISTAYLPFAELVGTTWSFLPFICVLSVSIVFMALLLPETKNKSIEEIVAEFRGRARTLSRRATAIPRRMTTAPGDLQPLLEVDEPNPKRMSTSAYGAM